MAPFQAARLAFAITLLAAGAGCGGASPRRPAAEEKLPDKLITLPAGTRFTVRMLAEIHAGQTSGTRIEGELAAPIAAFGETVVERATPVVTLLTRRDGGQAGLKAIQFKLKGGKVLDILSDEQLVPGNEPRKAEALRIDAPAGRLIGFRLQEPLRVAVEQRRP